MKFNSTLKTKYCKCSEGCKSFPSMGWKGYNYSHAPQKLKESQTKKQVANRKKAWKAKISKQLHQAAIVDASEVEQALWYIERSKEMTGKCAECLEKTCKGDSKYWKYSICHILPKAIFSSVKTHKLNFIELCYFGNSHHSNFDNNGYEYMAEKMPNAWKIVVERFKLMYPYIKEKSKIPDILLQQIDLNEI